MPLGTAVGRDEVVVEERRAVSGRESRERRCGACCAAVGPDQSQSRGASLGGNTGGGEKRRAKLCVMGETGCADGRVVRGRDGAASTVAIPTSITSIEAFDAAACLSGCHHIDVARNAGGYQFGRARGRVWQIWTRLDFQSFASAGCAQIFEIWDALHPAVSTHRSELPLWS